MKQDAPKRDDAADIRRVFDAFVKAVKESDLEGFLALHHPDSVGGVDEKLFERNARRAREHGFEFRLTGFTVENDVAILRFDVIPKPGSEEHRDSAEVTLLREAGTWRLHEV